MGRCETADDLKAPELRDLPHQSLDHLSPKGEKPAYLAQSSKEVAPEDLYAQEMKELLLWGKGEQYLWSVNIPQ